MRDLKALAAERWFGYGHWGSRFWFVGKEPGGEDDQENYASWARLGGLDLIDCREHDLDYRGDERGIWHIGKDGCGRPRLQNTWRPLIALLLAYKGKPEYDPELIRDYQANDWGRFGGETCVVELSAVAVRSTTVREPLRLHEVDRRVGILGAKLASNSPEFVVFYGSGVAQTTGVLYSEYWRRIAGARLQEGIPVLIGTTVCCHAPHPTSYGLRNEYWTGLGQTIARTRAKGTER